jgi:type I restriction enzyme S subunit
MLRPESLDVTPAYLEMFLRSPVGKALALGFAKAVAQPSLSMATIRMIPIALPPLGEQQRIVAEVDRRLSVVEEVETVVNANLQRASRLRQSILQWAFEGKMFANRSMGSRAEDFSNADPMSSYEAGK